MKRSRRFFPLPGILLAALLAATTIPSIAPAQDASFSASVSRNRIGLGEQFEISYTLSGANPNAVRNFRAPDLNKDFILLGGPNQSTSLQIVNGSFSGSVTYSYYLQPRKMGKYSIPPATITCQGQTFTSNALSVEVVVGSPSVPQRQPGAPQAGSQSAPQGGNTGDQLFLRASVDKSEVYVGEPVVVTYKVYTRVPIYNFNLKKQPRTVGFWSEEFTVPSQIDGTIETVNGRQYKAYLIRKVALFPTEAGTLEVEPLEVSGTIRVRQRRQSTGDSFFDKFFDDPFFDQYQNVDKDLASQPLRISVRPLPREGQPASFRGAVGEFAMNTTMDRTALKTNETATLKVRIEGKGNIKLLEAPQAEFPADVDHYDPRIEESIVKDGAAVSGVKSFSYLLLPRYPGERTIQPVEFSYFDPRSRKYVTLKSQPFVMQVQKGSGEPPATAGRPVDMLAQDVGPLKSSLDGLRRADTPAIPWAGALLCYLLPAAAAILLMRYRRKRIAELKDVAGMRVRRATKVAEKRLAQSKQYLDAGKTDEYYLEIARALWGYAQDRFTIPTSEASHEVVAERLGARGIDAGTTAEFLRAVDLTERARYSPTRALDEEMRGLYEQARAAIIAVEQRIRT